METRTDILNELKAISPTLAAMEKVNVFEVPQRYFDQLSESVLASLNKELGDVPEKYFDHLADNILAKIKLQEAAETDLSPALQSIRGINVFEVPQGYFENLSTEIVDKTVTIQPAKVISFGSRIVKYAVAAALTGVVALGVYKYTNNNPTQPNDIVSVAKLDASIEKGKDMNDKQFNETLENLSADDIAKYLETNFNEKEIESLASNIEENSLPSQDDYFTDEKTLENYLEELDAVQTSN
ncbi:hypothetical protein ACQ33O_01905 [Ferruginibacter sp. SUN002]|uniref:hypothetical protein n=1 Tax=Ferruginibacter sp. SUN002 TaxID=2937789 RepID=UPI003D3655DB